jgi:hypothetical protein
MIPGLAAEGDDRAVALIGENDADRAVMAHALDDDPAVTGADDIGAADAHVAGLFDCVVRPADVTTATAMAFEPVPAAVTAMIADDETATGATDRKFETDAACIGGGGGGCDAGSGDNEGGECIADEGFHDCSPDLAAFHALSVCP